jgi:voltage-gated sodium channel
MDADYAAETTELARTQIISQASTFDVINALFFAMASVMRSYRSESSGRNTPTTGFTTRLGDMMLSGTRKGDRLTNEDLERALKQHAGELLEAITKMHENLGLAMKDAFAKSDAYRPSISMGTASIDTRSFGTNLTHLGPGETLYSGQSAAMMPWSTRPHKRLSQEGLKPFQKPPKNAWKRSSTKDRFLQAAPALAVNNVWMAPSHQVTAGSSASHRSGGLSDEDQFVPHERWSPGSTESRSVLLLQTDESIAALDRQISDDHSESAKASKKMSLRYNHAGNQSWDSNSLHMLLLDLVNTRKIDLLSVALVILNAFWIGYEVDVIEPNKGQHWPLFARFIDNAFCVFFTVELIVRLAAHGRSFFASDAWLWNILDCVLVGAQLVNELMPLLGLVVCSDNDMSMARIIRILRIVRVLRMIRLIRFVGELRLVIASIMGSMKCLFWTLVLLHLLMYIVAVFIRQTFVELGTKSKRGVAWPEGLQSLHHDCSSLGSTIIMLFASITGGINWKNLVYPFIEGGYPTMGCVLVCYIAFVIFALMNVVTGVFAERAMLSAEEDSNQFLVSNLSNLFSTVEGEDFTITKEQFHCMLDRAEMIEYCDFLNLDHEDAFDLFDILDMEDCGAVNRDELISGLLRLRGNAKALDLTFFMKQTNLMNMSLSRQMVEILDRLEKGVPARQEEVVLPEYIVTDTSGFCMDDGWPMIRQDAPTGM